MGKQECCVCNKEMGRFEIKFPKSDLKNYQNDPRVQKMNDDDRFCIDCKTIIVKMPEDEKNVELKVRFDDINQRSEEYKKHWDKGGVIQFKNERIAIIHRMVGAQVQFIVAYDDLTKEGYRLMAQNEGKTGEMVF